MSDKCPCKSDLAYADCCGPYISGAKSPPTAEAMMRSRYTAFCNVEVDYIRRTRHPKSQNKFDEKGTHRWASESKWLGLEIIKTKAGGVDDDKGSVEFVAKYKDDGELQDHHEVAEFLKVDGAWLFVDGDFIKPDTFVRATVKVGRNDPCPCGSGKKFKKCCG